MMTGLAFAHKHGAGVGLCRLFSSDALSPPPPPPLPPSPLPPPQSHGSLSAPSSLRMQIMWRRITDNSGKHSRSSNLFHCVPLECPPALPPLHLKLKTRGSAHTPQTGGWVFFFFSCSAQARRDARACTQASVHTLLLPDLEPVWPILVRAFSICLPSL